MLHAQTQGMTVIITRPQALLGPGSEGLLGSGSEGLSKISNDQQLGSKFALAAWCPPLNAHTASDLTWFIFGQVQLSARTTRFSSGAPSKVAGGTLSYRTFTLKQALCGHFTPTVKLAPPDLVVGTTAAGS